MRDKIKLIHATYSAKDCPRRRRRRSQPNALHCESSLGGAAGKKRISSFPKRRRRRRRWDGRSSKFNGAAAAVSKFRCRSSAARPPRGPVVARLPRRSLARSLARLVLGDASRPLPPTSQTRLTRSLRGRSIDDGSFCFLPPFRPCYSLSTLSL